MIKDERVLELIEIIKKKKRIAVKELAEITFSSTSTLRRDLIFLENQGLIKRKHGYVTLSSMNTIELSHQIREGESTRQKRLIASLAKDFIRSGMCIYLDSSTTVYELCPYLKLLKIAPKSLSHLARSNINPVPWSTMIRKILY